ncbi:MAG: phytoene/squalene synthase family protein [Notoacmeibacter sp.]|nr:phytoene/squalene synthase family protein [Notoacmeibacter sp.]MCC0031834.1 phytoene/squalene synthase family protein [Brucellaceae bacterium]
MTQPGRADSLVLLKQGDSDRYLATLYAPEAKRHDLAALYAFNLEIARIRDLIREPLPGEIRLQWWRDALDGSEPGAAADLPAAAAMARLIAAHDLPRAMLENYFEARIFDLYDDPMPSMNDLEGWCGETAGTILQFAAMILDRDAAMAAGGEAAGHAACAQAITGLVRLLPLHRARGQCYVPAEMLAACGLTRDEYLTGPATDKGKALVDALVEAARQHYARFIGAAQSLPQVLLPAYLPLAPVPHYLNQAAKAGAGALSATAATGPLRQNWLFLRSAMRGFPKVTN